MGVIAEIPGMAKKKGRPRSGRNDITVKLDRQIATMAKVIAGRRGMTTTEFLDEMLRSPVNRLYNQLIREVADERQNDND